MAIFWLANVAALRSASDSQFLILLMLEHMEAMHDLFDRGGLRVPIAHDA